ncbi:hypothetical protein IPU62_15060 [Pseudogracilibacillus auburnensis]|nr:hypothetical protein [Pseudogracilibacillus auburnensis]
MKELKGSTFVLVDLNAENLDIITRLAKRMNEEASTGLIIESATTADYVITSITVKRDELWKKEWEITRKYEITPAVEVFTPGLTPFHPRFVRFTLEFGKFTLGFEVFSPEFETFTLDLTSRTACFPN